MISTFAWVAMLVASNLSLIIWRVLLRQEIPSWEPIVRIVGLLILLSLTLARPALRPLHGFVLALTALLIGNRIATLLEQSAAWMVWARAVPQHLQVFADTLMKLIPAALMALTLIGTGISRRELFLVKGDLHALSTWPWIGPLPWTLVGPMVILAFALPLAFQLTFTVRPDFSMLSRVVAALPLALVFAALNAASEEFRFRSVLLARLVPVLGSAHALWLTSVLFGLGHWFGRPSGPTGVLMTLVVGFILGKSMLETGGFAWAWLAHGIQDVLIFAFIVMAA